MKLHIDRILLFLLAASAWVQAETPKVADLAWANAHIRQGHGPLGSAVRGLNDPERPDQAGWGGKFVRPDPSKNHWFEDPAGTKTVYRWRPEVQSEFARRADWMLP